MRVDDRLKELMQLCADVQDGLSEAAMYSENQELASLFQAEAVEWNSFADRIFPVLLAMDHTSPEAYWTADPDRPWMSAGDGDTVKDDLTLCEECMLGLRSAKQKLQEAADISLPQVRQAILVQLSAIDNQIARVVEFVSDTDCLAT